MAGTKSTGATLAETIDFATLSSAWLTSYFAKKFPKETESNPSCPVEVVSRAVQRRLFRGESVAHIVIAHLLESAPFRAVAEHYHAQGKLCKLMTYQTPPTADDSLHLLRAVHDEDFCNWALRNPRLSHINDLPQNDVQNALVSASLGSKLAWLCELHVKTSDVPARALSWLLNMNESDAHLYAHDLHRFFASYPHCVSQWASLKNDALRNALACSSYLRDPEDQRRVAQLTSLGETTPEIVYWLRRNDSLLAALVSNPRTLLSVCAEIRSRVEYVRSSEPLVPHPHKSALHHALVDRGLVQEVRQEYDEVSNTRTLERLVNYCEIADVLVARENDIRKLLANPHVQDSQGDHLRILLRNLLETLPMNVRPTEVIGRTTSTKDLWELTRNSRQKGVSFEEMLGSDVKYYPSAAPFYLHHLGEDAATWDAFLALADSWGGTVAELLATAKNLQ